MKKITVKTGDGTMYEKEKYTLTLEEGLFYERSKVWAVRDGDGKLIKSFYQKSAAIKLLARLEETENRLLIQHKARPTLSARK